MTLPLPLQAALSLMGLFIKSCPCRTGKDLPAWGTVLTWRRLGWAQQVGLIAYHLQPWMGSRPQCQKAPQLLWAAPGQLVAQQRAETPGHAPLPAPPAPAAPPVGGTRLRVRGLHGGAGRLGALPDPGRSPPVCAAPCELHFLLLADRALFLQAWPVRWAVAAAGQLHPLGGRLPLHSHLWHVLCLPVVSTTCSRGPGGECYKGRLPSWERKAPFPSVDDAGHEE